MVETHHNPNLASFSSFFILYIGSFYNLNWQNTLEVLVRIQVEALFIKTNLKTMKKILLIILFSFVSISFLETKVLPRETEDISFLQGELNDSTLYLALQYYEIKHPRIVLAQAKLESGNYKSKHCINKNNLFGLYNSKKKRYYSFEHWSHSVLAYKNMVEYKYKGGDYYRFLDKVGYASDPFYIDKVKRIENNLEI